MLAHGKTHDAVYTCRGEQQGRERETAKQKQAESPADECP
jgi:hypothetical protein